MTDTVCATLGRNDEALECGEKALARFDEDDDPEDAYHLHYEFGRVLWFGEKDRARALERAHAALALWRGSPQALWLLRELTGRVSADAKYFRLMIHGDWMEPTEEIDVASFFSNCDVVADSEEEALERVRELEPEEVRASLTLEEAEVLAEAPSQPTGVYRLAPYQFYPREMD
ncbi:MAG: hypothetical protein AAF368_03020 [Planctomycetota bacterium]